MASPRPRIRLVSPSRNRVCGPSSPATSPASPRRWAARFWRPWRPMPATPASATTSPPSCSSAAESPYPDRMRRLVLAGLVPALSVVAAAQAPRADSPMQADAFVRLLADLEAALAAGRESDFTALAAADAPDLSRRIIEAADATDAASTVAIRERARRPTETGIEILAEVFVVRGRRGRVATWQLGARTRPGRPDQAELTAFSELG